MDSKWPMRMFVASLSLSLLALNSIPTALTADVGTCAPEDHASGACTSELESDGRTSSSSTSSSSDDSEDSEDFDSSDDDICHDFGDDCEQYTEDDCENNPGYMKYNCAHSCATCAAFERAIDNSHNKDVCTDNLFECKSWVQQGECGYNSAFMLEECQRSCFVCYEETNQFGADQRLPHIDDKYYDATRELIGNSIAYVRDIWARREETRAFNFKCRNMEADCSIWAARDGCEDGDDDGDNGWSMATQCAPACQTCHLLDRALECPMGEDNDPVWKPGDLNRLFEEIVDDASGLGEYTKYNPIALSRPELKTDGTPAGVDEDGPWVVLLDNFITDEEAEAFIEAGKKAGYERSSDVGVENPDGTHEEEVSDGRTSHNAWCDVDLCDSDPVIGPVITRIASATKTHVHNSESLQLLQYEVGQYYNQHHDYIEYQADLPCGVRIMTLFLYLNDVEEGGGTSFPLLDVTVQPKKGSALLWPSVLDAAPESKDYRTDHEALPVIKGLKYGANAWIHSRNYRLAEEKDCT